MTPNDSWAGPRKPIVLAAALSLGLHSFLMFGLQASEGAAPSIERSRTLTTRLARAPLSHLAPGDAVSAAPERLPDTTAWDPVRPADAAPPQPSSPAAPTGPGFAGDGVLAEATAGVQRALPGVEIAALDAFQPARYYLPDELQVKPQALDPILPDPPGDVERNGYVKLLLRINELGGVDEVSVIESQPEGLFEVSARTAFRKARFVPGRLDGAAVKSQLMVQVDYRLRGASGTRLSRQGY